MDASYAEGEVVTLGRPLAKLILLGALPCTKKKKIKIKIGHLGRTLPLEDGRKKILLSTVLK